MGVHKGALQRIAALEDMISRLDSVAERKLSAGEDPQVQLVIVSYMRRILHAQRVAVVDDGVNTHQPGVDQAGSFPGRRH